MKVIYDTFSIAELEEIYSLLSHKMKEPQYLSALYNYGKFWEINPRELISLIECDIFAKEKVEDGDIVIFDFPLNGETRDLTICRKKEGEYPYRDYDVRAFPGVIVYKEIEIEIDYWEWHTRYAPTIRRNLYWGGIILEGGVLVINPDKLKNRTSKLLEKYREKSTSSVTRKRLYGGEWIPSEGEKK